MSPNCVTNSCVTNCFKMCFCRRFFLSHAHILIPKSVSRIFRSIPNFPFTFYNLKKKFRYLKFSTCFCIRSYASHMPVICQSYGSDMQVKCQSYVGHKSVICRAPPCGSIRGRIIRSNSLSLSNEASNLYLFDFFCHHLKPFPTIV